MSQAHPEVQHALMSQLACLMEHQKLAIRMKSVSLHQDSAGARALGEAKGSPDDAPRTELT